MQIQPGITRPDPDTPALAVGDEQALWSRWRDRADEAARATLIDLHVDFARILAGKLYARRTHDDFEFDDYLQFGRIGLIEALDRYDPALGAQFRTFAASRIEGAILSGIESMSERQKQFAWQRRMRAQRVQSLADEAPDLPSAQGQELLAQLARVGLGLALGFLLEGTGMLVRPDDAVASVGYERVELAQLRRWVASQVAQLTEREQQVVQLHYFDDIAFEEIATRLGLTRGRVSQLHGQALKRLHGLLAGKRQIMREG